MYLTKLQEEREYAQKRGWTGEVAKIDKELAKRAKDKTASKRNGIEMGYEKVMQSSIKDEGSDADKYEKMAMQAKAEGRTQDAKVLCNISKDEARHEKALKKIEQKTKSFRMQELDRIQSKIAETNDLDDLWELHYQAKDIWYNEHNFGSSKNNEKAARATLNQINAKIDRKRRELDPEYFARIEKKYHVK
jgi:rubrerythrin